MEKLSIKNGQVFDPLNNIDGEVKDILIEKGKIVEKFTNESDVKIIDAKGKTIIPAALDIHTHVASQQLNNVRLLGTKNKIFQEYWKGLTLEYIARSYISNGYTFILEANVFPSLAKTTIFDFKRMPVLDKAMLLNVSNLWQLELEYQKGKIEDMAAFLKNLLKETKGFGLKVYNPFENESDWNFSLLRDDLTKSGRLFNFSALDVYENLTKCNEYLGLPHSVHAHIEGYETEQGKKNLPLILDKIDSLELKKPIKVKHNQTFHIAHASAYNLDGDNSNLVNVLNSSEKFDLDIGFITFNPINTLLTSDKHLIDFEMKNVNPENKSKIIRSALEFEGDSFATLRTFRKDNKLHCTLWGNALELALKVQDKWKVQFSMNYPNYGDINDVPEVATWLMSREARKNFSKGMSPDFAAEKFLAKNETVINFKDFIIITRSSPAKSLGLGKIKGNLGVGADGDLNVLNININEVDTDKDYKLVKNALSNIEYVIKSGKIIKKEDKIDLEPQGHIFWSEGEVEIKDSSYIISKKKEFYQKYYSIFYDSLKTPIADTYLRKI